MKPKFKELDDDEPVLAKKPRRAKLRPRPRKHVQKISRDWATKRYDWVGR
jgi:hypothetical protein